MYSCTSCALDTPSHERIARSARAPFSTFGLPERRSTTLLLWKPSPAQPLIATMRDKMYSFIPTPFQKD
ncbi:hypothetical protein KCU61_g290, partial [Aureobasidium melanogenum]